MGSPSLVWFGSSSLQRFCVSFLVETRSMLSVLLKEVRFSSFQSFIWTTDYFPSVCSSSSQMGNPQSEHVVDVLNCVPVTRRAGPDQPMPDVRLLRSWRSTFGYLWNHLEWHSTIWARTLVISLLLYLFFCIYFVTWHLVPITYCMYTSWPCIYFRNSSGSSINSSTILRRKI